MAEQHQCEERRGERVIRQCSHNAIVQRDGKWYCEIHDSEYIKAKNEAWNAKWAKEWAEDNQRQELTDARLKATDELTLEELQQVTPELIRNALARKS